MEPWPEACFKAYDFRGRASGDGTGPFEPLLQLMDEADVILVYNGFGFDYPVLRKYYGGPSKLAALALTSTKTPQISYSSTSAELSDGSSYPYFLRTPPSDAFADLAAWDERERTVATDVDGERQRPVKGHAALLRDLEKERYDMSRRAIAKRTQDALRTPQPQELGKGRDVRRLLDRCGAQSPRAACTRGCGSTCKRGDAWGSHPWGTHGWWVGVRGHTSRSNAASSLELIIEISLLWKIDRRWWW